MKGSVEGVGFCHCPARFQPLLHLFQALLPGALSPSCPALALSPATFVPASVALVPSIYRPPSSEFLEYTMVTSIMFSADNVALYKLRTSISQIHAIKLLFAN